MGSETQSEVQKLSQDELKKILKTPGKSWRFSSS